MDADLSLSYVMGVGQTKVEVLLGRFGILVEEAAGRTAVTTGRGGA